jgi:hypothetical protein
MIQVSNTGQMMPSNFTELMEFCKMLAASGMVPDCYTHKPGAVFLALQMGAEVGLTPTKALANIAVINGRASLWGDAMLALVRSHPVCADVQESLNGDGTEATCVAKRHKSSPVTRTFSVEDAQRAGLWGKKGPWTNYPKRMLQMRARGFALRDAFPDVLAGMITREEARDIVDLTPDYIDTTDEPQEGRHEARPPKTKRKPKPKTKAGETPPPEPGAPPELNDAATEFLGMIAHAQTEDEIAALVNDAAKRKFPKDAMQVIHQALKAKDAEIVANRGGKPQGERHRTTPRPAAS